MIGASGELLAAVAVIAAAYCLGGLNGLWLAWTQRARMDRYAFLVAAREKAEAAQRKLNDLEGIER